MWNVHQIRHNSKENNVHLYGSSHGNGTCPVVTFKEGNVPYFGIPLLVLFLLSCIFGGYGVVLMILEKYKDVKGLINDIKKIKENGGSD